MVRTSILLVLSLLSIEIGKLKVSTSFVHPGLLHTTADLQRIRSMVAGQYQPWYSAYLSFAADGHSSLSYPIQGPDAVVTRDGNYAIQNAGNGHLADDSVAVLQLALMYSITNNTAYAVLATSILEAWANTLTVINGT